MFLGTTWKTLLATSSWAPSSSNPMNSPARSTWAWRTPGESCAASSTSASSWTRASTWSWRTRTRWAGAESRTERQLGGVWAHKLIFCFSSTASDPCVQPARWDLQLWWRWGRGGGWRRRGGRRYGLAPICNRGWTKACVGSTGCSSLTCWCENGFCHWCVLAVKTSAGFLQVQMFLTHRTAGMCPTSWWCCCPHWSGPQMPVD